MIDKNFWNYLLIFLLFLFLVGFIFWLIKKEGIFFSQNFLVSKKEKNDNLIGKEDSEKSISEKEVIDSLIIIRQLDKDLIKKKITQGKEFLFKMEHPILHGFYKRYDPQKDYLEARLYPVYSASIIYTFLYILDFEKDDEILKKLSDWGNFLLSMQNREEKNNCYGGFHYSYFLNNQRKEKKFVVGTAALGIFTLLRLYELTGQEKYLVSAKLAGDWLIKMQTPKGPMKPYCKYTNGKLICGEKISLLYNGQSLSALSRLYKITGEEKYLNSAKKIASFFISEYEREKGFIEDEYRKKNPISNAWVVMSLIEFYKVQTKENYKKIIFELSDLILEKQNKDERDILNHGSWQLSYSTSGIGWLAEVMTEVYRFCLEEKNKDCQKYQDSVIRAIRWLIQNTYSKENTSSLPNPERALGSLFWNKDNKFVRTDSVCHALNAYLRIMPYLKEGNLLSIP